MSPRETTGAQAEPVFERAPYVAPEVIDYGDAKEATKGGGVGPGPLDGPVYTS